MSHETVTRRDFLGGLLTTGIGVPLLHSSLEAQVAPGAPQNVRVLAAPAELSKTVLGPADFQYAGAFRMPPSVSGLDAGWGLGLALRRVGGEVRFLSMVLGGQVYEVARPQLTPTADAEARVVRLWGTVTSGKLYTAQYGTGPEVTPRGLYWDEPDRRLYWSYGNEYNVGSNDDPSVGYSTLNDATGAVTPFGSWRFSGRGCKATMGGVLGIPGWFSQAYCNGQRLGAGFGGYYSVATTGPIHMGPSLCSFGPPTPASQPERSSLTHKALVGYPFNSVPYTNPDRGHRDADYRTDFDGWQPKNGVGYWTWADVIWQSAVWIDTPTRHGVVYLPTLGNGRVWYESSTIWAERGSHCFSVYDPASLASVATGEKQQHSIQAARTWPVQYPGLTYPLQGWRDSPIFPVTGTVFDPVDSMLYVAVRFGVKGAHVVHAYQVV
jgi:hypothetical protein